MAITVEYGRCAQCDENQPKLLQNCRTCGALLPWAKGAKKAAKASSGSGFSLGDLAWKAMGVQILGALVFVAGMFFFAGNVLGFFPTFPGLGYITMLIGGAIWGAGAQMPE